MVKFGVLQSSQTSTHTHNPIISKNLMVKYIGEIGDFLDPPRIMTIMKKKMMLHAMMGNREEDTAQQLPHQLVTQAQPVLH